MKRMILIAIAAMTVCSAVAFAAASPDTIAVTGSATKGGTKKKPKAVSASFANTAVDADGNRPTTPATLNWKWDGIKSYGKYFPVCTAATIDAAQSDASCPAKSLVATGKIAAFLGPDSGDQSAATAITCDKDLKVYNAGKGKSTLFVVGDPAACAGVSYLPPVALTTTPSATGEEVNFAVPGNLQAPLPGLRGSIVKLSLTYPKMTVKKGKKTYGYLMSTGCKSSTRQVHFRTGFESFDDSNVASSAGKC